VTFIATPTTPVLTSKWQLQPGDIVTFTYQGFWERTNKPKSPSIVRVRLDKTWQDVVSDSKSSSRIPRGRIHFDIIFSVATHSPYFVSSLHFFQEKMRQKKAHGLLE
jgi:hypothetical protein